MSLRGFRGPRPDRQPFLFRFLALLIALWLGGLPGARLPKISSGAPLARDVRNVAALATPLLAPAQPTVRPFVPLLVRPGHAALPWPATTAVGPIAAGRAIRRSLRPPSRLRQVHPPCSRAPPTLSA
jgi:hypothetical protein